MPFEFMTVPIQDEGEAVEALNGFLSSRRVLAIDRRWVEQGASSFWSFCIEYLSKGTASKTEGGRSDRKRGKGVDYKEVLSPEDFVVFAKLRDLRKEIGQREGVPVYTIFNNEQLADMVRQRATTKEALQKIDGVGEAKSEKYGEAMLGVLTRAWKNGHEKSGTPV
jgi:superfamily II DNA helicase RecQ